jgi:putative PIN family toxin of toxin-antitoxin system
MLWLSSDARQYFVVCLHLLIVRVENVAAMLIIVDKLRIAIDTNVFIASITRPRGTSARIVKAWLDGQLEVVASAATTGEAELVLGGGWLGRIASREAVESLLEALRTRSVRVEKPSRIGDLRLKDEGDLRLVEAAVAAGARYIVTTDREFLRQQGYGDVVFVTPGEFAVRWRE